MHEAFGPPRDVADPEMEALRFVNFVRTQKLNCQPVARLPQGYRRSEVGCPIAAALPGKWRVGRLWVQRYGPHEPGEKIPLTGGAAVFVDEFDRGKFPHLMHDEAREAMEAAS